MSYFTERPFLQGAILPLVKLQTKPDGWILFLEAWH